MVPVHPRQSPEHSTLSSVSKKTVPHHDNKEVQVQFFSFQTLEIESLFGERRVTCVKCAVVLTTVDAVVSPLQVDSSAPSTTTERFESIKSVACLKVLLWWIVFWLLCPTLLVLFRHPARTRTLPYAAGAR